MTYVLNSTGTDHSTWWNYTVSMTTSGGTAFSNNQSLVLLFSQTTTLPQATTSQAGIVYLADDAMTLAGPMPHAP